MKLAEDLRRSVLQAAIEGKLTGGRCEGWRFVRLDEIGEIIGGGTPSTLKSEYWVHGQIAWITPADMGTLKSKYISHGARNITEKGLASSSARIMPKGSIIFSSRAPIGYIAIAENDLCTNQGCKSVKLYDGVLSEYVYFALLAIRDDIKKMGSGTTFKEISGRVFSSVIIPLPPIDEQRRIVSRLDVILPLIAELESAENELEALERKFPGDMRDALLQAAIEGRLTGSNMDNWRYVRLGECTSIIMGQSPKGECINNSDGMEFHQGKIFFGDKVIQDSKIRTSEAPKIAPADSVLLSVRAPVGKVNITDREICIGRGLAAIKGNDGMPTEFIYYLLQTLEQTFIAKSTGTTFKAITSATIHNQLIHLPPIDEQQKIVSRLNELLPLCEAMKGE